ncbi:MAG: hypothetical protein EON98_00315 [Chitinophagaceae bacterium]|nr:MAG: hypothetical protein EON98_00315 [Chitinophagaceae bacterium]
METWIVVGLMVVCFIGMISSSGNVSKSEDEIVYEATLSGFFFPDKLVFSKDKVVHKRRYGFLFLSSTTQTIPFKKVAGIKIHRNLVGANIEIVGNGVQAIIVKGFASRDTDMIEQSLNMVLEDYSSQSA